MFYIIGFNFGNVELKGLDDSSSGRLKLQNSVLEDDYEDNFGSRSVDGSRRDGATFNPLDYRNTTRGYERIPMNRQQGSRSNRKPTHHTTASAGSKVTGKHSYNTVIIRTDDTENGLEGSSGNSRLSTTMGTVLGLFLALINYHYRLPILGAVSQDPRHSHFE